MIELTLVLRPPETSKAVAESLLAGRYDASAVKPENVAANPEDLKAVDSFAAAHDLQVIKTDPVARTMRIAGSAADIEKAFGVRPDEIPAPLKSIVIAVLGRNPGPVAKHHAPDQ